MDNVLVDEGARSCVKTPSAQMHGCVHIDADTFIH